MLQYQMNEAAEIHDRSPKLAKAELFTYNNVEKSHRVGTMQFRPIQAVKVSDINLDNERHFSS